MNNRSPFKFRWTLTLLALCTLLCVDARAQLKFVQVTDPHLFDEGTDAADNQSTLSACINQINSRVGEGVDYKFIVITGDIGIESLVGKLDEKKEKASTEADRKKIDREIDQEIARGVGVLASILSASKVHLWLFVPGNNDLIKEQPDKINYYHQFLGLLESTLRPKGIEIKDLCPKDDSQVNSEDAKSDVYIAGPFAFIGFNNASFKNNDCNNQLISGKTTTCELRGKKMICEPTRLSPEEIRARQQKYVQQVIDQVNTLVEDKQKGVAYTYIFYHIPEVDDPYLISGNQDYDEKLWCKLKERRNAVNAGIVDSSDKDSSWFVNHNVRALWDEFIRGDKSSHVKGLFAGHLHDWKRETYQNYHWLEATNYPSASLSKLYICPPLAVKRQKDQPDQARGFVEVSLDGTGKVLDEWGRSGAHIFWYDPAAKTFDSGVNEKEAGLLEQLAFGQMLEDSGRYKDAEAAYAKALDSKSPLTRGKASDSLQRVAEKQVSLLNAYFFTPWGYSLSPEQTALFIASIVLLILFIIWLVGKSRFKRAYASLSAAWLGVILISLFIVALTLLVWPGMYLLNRRGQLPAHVAVLTTIGLVLLSLWLVWRLMKRRGNNKLVITPLTDTTEHKLGATFPHVLAKIRQEIVAYENYSFRTASSVTVIKMEEEANLGELVESIVPGGMGKVISWLVNKISQPQYHVRGSLQSASPNLIMIITIESAGRPLKTWFADFAADQLFERASDLAYEVLIYTVEPDLYANAP